MSSNKSDNREMSLAEVGQQASLLNIFGPCSAESREQVLATAEAIALNFPKAIFRAGIWKPRTRPNNFEGIGEIGLEWLKEVHTTTGLTVATEVANTKHVEACLKAGMKHVWLGARTTVNPFYVQEIAEAMRGSEMTVYVKNPVVPDVQLWLGAIERVQQAGAREVLAIHRGFHHFDSKPFRNLPQWEIPIELMALRPDVPIICDISHICGNPALFPATAQKAMDLNMAGLHVEVHPEPSKALSDAQQQITPVDLVKLIQGVAVRKPTTDDPDFQRSLESIRNEIDKIDDQLLRHFVKRMELVKKIGFIKRDNEVTILQVSRWQEIMRHYMEEGMALGLSEAFLKDLLNSLHDESMRAQHDVMNK